MTSDGERGENILVVDDDRAVSLAIQRHLTRAGYHVQCVAGGAQALEMAAEGPVDLVVLDLVMPDLNGIETCRALRALPGWETLPILILTGTYDQALYRQALQCGADDFLTKPVKAEELLLRVGSLIRIGGLMADLRAGVATVEAQNEIILKNREERERLQAFLLHDLKNPLTAILLQAELMLEEEPETSGPWHRVLGSAEHVMNLVLTWMDHIKAGQAGLQPALAPVRLGPFLEEVLGRQELLLKARRLRGTLELEEPELTHAMDAVLMGRVLGNLLDNCLRFSPEQGRLALGAQRAASGALRLHVSDQGPGVPVHLRQRMFDLYAQLENAGAHGGAHRNRGLGLAFCEAAVQAHGGRIWVEDNPGGGSRFLIELPSAD